MPIASGADILLRRGRTLLILLLLLLAGAHCTLSIFYDNESWLDMPKYLAGTERSPFQERVGVIPLLRYLSHTRLDRSFAARLSPRERRHGHDEPISPDDAATILLALLAVACSIALCSWFGRLTLPKLWWIPPAILIAALYASYAARYEHALWFPYDLPHMFLFGAACAFLLTGRPWWFLLFFLLDLPVRETSIYLVLLSLAYTAPRYSRLRSAATTLGLLLCWLAVHLTIAHFVHGTSSETGSRFVKNLHYFLAPGDLPTVASAAGFLLIPVWLGRRRLDLTSYRFLLLSLPCLLVSMYFGILIETRVFIEWTIPVVLLATQELATSFTGDVHASPSLATP